MYMLLIATCSAALMVLLTNADTINLDLLPRFYPVTTDEHSFDIITLPKPVTMVGRTLKSVEVSFQVYMWII